MDAIAQRLQDIRVQAGIITGSHTLNISNNAYLYVISGNISGKGFKLKEGDGAELDADLTTDFNAHILLFQEQHRS